MNKLISIVTPTYNEENNIKKLCFDIAVEMKKLDYDYEHIVIDNKSSDSTISILKFCFHFSLSWIPHSSHTSS